MHFVPFEHLWTGTGVPATPVWDQGGQYCLRLCDSYSNRHVQVNNLPLSADTMVWNWVPAQRLRVFLEPSLGSLDILQALKKFPFEPLKTTSSKSSHGRQCFLLAITLTQRASELHALCYTEPYIVRVDPEVLMAERWVPAKSQHIISCNATHPGCIHTCFFWSGPLSSMCQTCCQVLHHKIQSTPEGYGVHPPFIVYGR